MKNNSGTLNNVMKVAPADFEILEALETDNAATSKKTAADIITGRPPSNATGETIFSLKFTCSSYKWFHFRQ